MDFLIRLEFLKQMIFEELGDKRRCIYCGSEDYDIAAYFCNPKNLSDYSQNFKEGFVPALLLTCTDCGKKRVKTMGFGGSNTIEYVM